MKIYTYQHGYRSHHTSCGSQLHDGYRHVPTLNYMQKILVLILAIVSSGLVFTSQNNTAYAACSSDSTSVDYCNESDKASDVTSASNTSSANTIFTSEMVPGAKCQCVTGGGTSESL